ncbi:MAG: glycerol kinase GlpK [Desulfovibrio sp.]|nr:MAG: glycerol kinase GlpK [Desulfovibrio sp.]
MERLILAIDQGTGGTKTVLFDSQGRIAAKAAHPLPSLYPQVGFVEQDPLEIYNNVITSLRLCLDQASADTPDVLARIISAGISNQRETFLLWDDSGNPLCNAVVWQCKRSVPICEKLKGSSVEQEIRSRTGLIVDPYFSGTKLAWLMENNATVKDAVRSGKARFGTVDTWLLYKLTRGESYFTDYTNASRTLLFNIHTLTWDAILLEAFGVDPLILPQTAPSSAHFGSSDFEGLFPHPIPISGMIGDSHAAAFGQGCFSPGQAKATLGTGSSILCNIGGSPKPSGHGMVSTICWSTGDRVDHALEGIIVTCGATIQWLRDKLGLMASSADTEAMARSVDSSGGVFLIPAFSGMGAPHWKMDAKASLVGLTLGSDKNHVARAALESVAFQIKDVIMAMEEDSGVPLLELKLDGGMTSNKFLMEMITDLLGVPTVTMGMEEVSALGAAYLAGLESGMFAGLDALPSFQARATTYVPSSAAEHIRENHATWREMIHKHC